MAACEARLIGWAGGAGRADAPRRSAAQRLEALRRANEIRIGRAQLRRNLAIGGVRIAEILAASPECAEMQKIDDLLLALLQVRSGAGRQPACRLPDQPGSDSGRPQR